MVTNGITGKIYYPNPSEVTDIIRLIEIHEHQKTIRNFFQPLLDQIVTIDDTCQIYGHVFRNKFKAVIKMQSRILKPQQLSVKNLLALAQTAQADTLIRMKIIDSLIAHLDTQWDQEVCIELLAFVGQVWQQDNPIRKNKELKEKLTSLVVTNFDQFRDNHITLLAHTFCYNWSVPKVYLKIFDRIISYNSPSIPSTYLPEHNYYFRTDNVTYICQNSFLNKLSTLSLTVLINSLLHTKRPEIKPHIKDYIFALIDSNFMTIKAKHQGTLCYLLSLRSNYDYEVWERLIPVLAEIKVDYQNDKYEDMWKTYTNFCHTGRNLASVKDKRLPEMQINGEVFYSPKK